MPKAESTIVFDASADDAIRRVNEWGGQPLPLSATAYHDGQLHVRLSGAEPAVQRRCASSAARRWRKATHVFWTSVRDHTHPFFRAVGDRALWRLSVKSTAPYTDLGGEQLIEWGGALRWLVARRAHRSREAARVGRGAGRPCHAVSREATAGATCSTRYPLHWPPCMRSSRRVRPQGHLQPRPARVHLLMQTKLSPNSATRARAARPTPSCARACIAASARRRARRISCWATSSTARAAASISSRRCSKATR